MSLVTCGSSALFSGRGNSFCRDFSSVYYGPCLQIFMYSNQMWVLLITGCCLTDLWCQQCQYNDSWNSNESTLQIAHVYIISFFVLVLYDNWWVLGWFSHNLIVWIIINSSSFGFNQCHRIRSGNYSLPRFTIVQHRGVSGNNHWSSIIEINTANSYLKTGSNIWDNQ